MYAVIHPRCFIFFQNILQIYDLHSTSLHNVISRFSKYLLTDIISLVTLDLNSKLRTKLVIYSKLNMACGREKAIICCGLSLFIFSRLLTNVKKIIKAECCSIYLPSQLFERVNIVLVSITEMFFSLITILIKFILETVLKFKM